MPTQNRKRSQQIPLLLLGAATLVASGCQNLNPIPDRSTTFNTEEECTAYWGSGECSLITVRGVQQDLPEGTYWAYSSATSMGTQAELEREGSTSIGQSLLTGVVRGIAQIFTHVLRGGFGHSHSHFGGTHT
ncbi:MAG TPA: hypothetical protein VIW47_09420 [Nitrospiraceae bacterium]|jgi:hypothetical protein